MEQFFNAVTISDTNLSNNSKTSLTNKSNYSNTNSNFKMSNSINHRFGNKLLSEDLDDSYICLNLNKTNNDLKLPSKYEIENDSNHNKKYQIYQRFEIDSPQSDSGCSLLSHMTYDGLQSHDSVDYMSKYSPKQQHNRVITVNNKRTLFNPSCENTMEFENKSLNNNRLKGFSSMLRRSRSSVTDHVPSPNLLRNLANPTPTPTESGPIEIDYLEHNSNGNESVRITDRFSKLRASLKQSFGWALTKPDFRMEAFAARQGEARALLKLRETRLDVSCLFIFIYNYLDIFKIIIVNFLLNLSKCLICLK